MTNEESDSPVWTASYWMQTTEDVARALATAAAAATSGSHRPSVIFSTKDDHSDGKLKKIQRHVAKVLESFSSPPAERKRVYYNPEVLTSQKRQWANVHMHNDQKIVKEPSRIFESIVVVGLSPYCDMKDLQKQMLSKSLDGPKTLSFELNSQNCASLEPQVLFVYPPERPLPLNYKDILSFCFPAGVEVHAVEKTPSLSALNEILLGQEHLNQNNLCFVFRLQVADGSTLYGCCAFVEEIVGKPSGLISMLGDEDPRSWPFSRFQMTTPRCYCILSRLPFFDLHFGVLKNIFAEERFQRLKNGIAMLELAASNQKQDEDGEEVPCDSAKGAFVEPSGRCNEGGESASCSVEDYRESGSFSVRAIEEKNNSSFGESEVENIETTEESVLYLKISNDHVKQINDKKFPDAILPMWRFHHYESSESSSSAQGSPCADENFRSHMEESELEETSSSGCEEPSDYDEILEWAKVFPLISRSSKRVAQCTVLQLQAVEGLDHNSEGSSSAAAFPETLHLHYANNHGSLQIICEYYRMGCPSRSSTITFHPLEHLHPVTFQRPSETVLYTAGSTIDLRSCSTSLEIADAHSALLAEEEATALSVWTIACLCGNLRLEHVLTIFAGALLEKQIVFICSNLGVLSALVLSIIPLIRPYQWQSLLLPVLPNDMLEFLDAPVPFVVGVKDKSDEVQSKLSNVILVDANKNQLKTASIPQLPRHKELLSALSPYHASLVGESYLAKKRPVHECTDIQVEAAKGFLAVLRSYLDSLCSNLRSHTITNVQSNDDKVSLLLKESFIDSYLSRDRPFMKLFVDTQLFSVHTDLVLSFYQKE